MDCTRWQQRWQRRQWQWQRWQRWWWWLLCRAPASLPSRLRAERRRRDAPDPTLTDDERAALEEAIDSMRGELTKAKLVGPDLGSSGSKWAVGARAPDGRIYYAPQLARTVLCFDPATGERPKRRSRRRGGRSRS